jgi:hypothetical protein
MTINFSQRKTSGGTSSGGAEVGMKKATSGWANTRIIIIIIVFS